MSTNNADFHICWLSAQCLLDCLQEGAKWLREWCHRAQVRPGSADAAGADDSLALAVSRVLLASRSADEAAAELFDLLGDGSFDAIHQILEHRCDAAVFDVGTSPFMQHQDKDMGCTMNPIKDSCRALAEAPYLQMYTINLGFQGVNPGVCQPCCLAVFFTYCCRIQGRVHMCTCCVIRKQEAATCVQHLHMAAWLFLEHVMKHSVVLQPGAAVIASNGQHTNVAACLESLPLAIWLPGCLLTV